MKEVSIEETDRDEGDRICRDGKPVTGEVVDRFGNGNISIVHRLREGIPHGLTEMWFIDGKRSGLENYACGARHGYVCYWHPSGSKQIVAIWVFGVSLLSRRWNERGDVIGEQRIILTPEVLDRIRIFEDSLVKWGCPVQRIADIEAFVLASAVDAADALGVDLSSIIDVPPG